MAAGGHSLCQVTSELKITDQNIEASVTFK